MNILNISNIYFFNLMHFRIAFPIVNSVEKCLSRDSNPGYWHSATTFYKMNHSYHTHPGNSHSLMLAGLHPLHKMEYLYQPKTCDKQEMTLNPEFQHYSTLCCRCSIANKWAPPELFSW